VTPTPPTRRSSCRYHHTACGRHFASLAAFDRHLVWWERDSGDRVRGCESPAAMPGLRIQSEDGVCHYRDPEAPVTVWEAVTYIHGSEQEALSGPGWTPDHKGGT
jgi:hypothetical protein